VAEWALQCHGGYGYIKEYTAEQYLRDVKIASIYEGTNGIQAMDLVARKLSMDGGAPLMALVSHINKFIEAHKNHPVLKDQVTALAAARDAWASVNGFFMTSAAEKKLLIPLVNATGYLSLCGDLLLGYLLVEQAALAWSQLGPLCQGVSVDPADGKAVAGLARENPEVRYLDGKLKTARFFCAYELPQVQAKAAAIKSADMAALQMLWDGE